MEEEKCYTVYMHVCKENQKTYVGLTSTRPKKRWNSGNGYKQNKYFYNAIKKYGWDNFEHIILFKNKTKNEAENLEILFIKLLLSNNRLYGYNIENGGNGKGRTSEETREKLRKLNFGKRKGKDNPCSKKVICDGIIYDSLTDMSEEYDININTVSNWLVGDNKIPKEFAELGLKYLDNQDFEYEIQDKPYKRRIICNNIVFESIQKCSDFYNIDRSLMKSYLLKNCRMPQYFIDLGLRYVDDNETIYQSQEDRITRGKVAICENRIFNSVSECANSYGVTANRMSRWLAGTRKMPQEFKEMGLAYYIEEDIEKSA